MEVITTTSTRLPFIQTASPQISIRPSTPSLLRLRSLKTRLSHLLISCNSLPNSSDRIALLLEVDGVLIDAYRSGNRQAFNVGATEANKDIRLLFLEGEYDPHFPVVLIIVSISKARIGLRKMDRTHIFRSFKIGWPTSLPTNEKDTFMKSVIEEKKKALAEYMSSKNTPLRPGVDKFIDDAFDEGICVVILTACSKFGEGTARKIVEKLGLARMLKVKVIGNKEIEESLYGQVVFGIGKFSSLDEEVANEASKAVAAEKKRIAEEVAAMLKLNVDINTVTPESLREIVAALRTGAENAEAPICNCVLVAGSQPLIAAAQASGMPCVVLRNSLTSRAEFQTAVVMDGFGDVDLTVPKLQLMLSRLSK